MINNLEHQYNWYNLEPNFRIFLSAVKNISHVSVKNYLSDIRYFFGWTSLLDSKISSPSDIMSPSVLDQYRTYLVSNKLPRRTVNRRLSSLRAFCDFLLTQNIIKSDPSKLMRNYSGHQNSNGGADTLEKFKANLQQQKVSQGELKIIEDDVAEFIILTGIKIT